MEKINVRGINFDSVTLPEACENAMKMVSSGEFHAVFTPNSEIVQLCCEESGMADLINSADMIIPDGAGVVLASKILGKPLKKGKVAGVDLGSEIARLAAEKEIGVYLFGGKPGVAESAAKNMKEKYPGLIISGTSDGYFSDDTGIIEKINMSGAKILYVCLGVPKQEKWIYENRKKLNVSLALGLGGSLDVYAGNVKRAPKIFISLGLEWFYRLIKEPKRIGRMMKLPKFIIGTIIYRIKGKE